MQSQSQAARSIRLDPLLLAWIPTALLAVAVTVLMARVRG